jgi:hypothetical protein
VSGVGLDSVELVMAGERVRPLPRAEVLTCVCRITGAQWGTTMGQLDESTRFVDDLGID